MCFVPFAINCVAELSKRGLDTLQHDFVKIMPALTFERLSRIKSFISRLTNRYFRLLLLITISIFKHQPPDNIFRASSDAWTP